MTPQAIVDLLLSLLPVVASVAPSVYAALFGTATVESMTTRAREALAKAGGTRAAMESLFEPPPAALAVAREMPQVSAHTSDRIRGLAACSSLTAEDREACAKGAAFIAAVVARADTVPAPSGTWLVKGARAQHKSDGHGIAYGEVLSVGNGSATVRWENPDPGGLAVTTCDVDDLRRPPGASVPEMQRRLASLKQEAAGNADAVRVEYLQAEIDVIESALKRAGTWGEPGEGD